MLKFGFVAQDIVDKGLVTWDEIDTIKKCLETCSDLPKYTDEQLITFYVACDKNEEETKKAIIMFHKLRTQTPQLFSKRSLEDPKVEEVLSVLILPKRTQDGCVFIFNKLVNTNYLQYDNIEHMKAMIMTTDAAIYDYPPKECVFIIDLEGLGVMHLTRLKFNTIRSCANYLQCGLPTKLKNIHFINSSYILQKLISLIRPFLTDHVANLIVTHTRNEMDAFREKYVSSEYLPAELEGDLPSMDVIAQDTLEKLRSIQSHFDDEEKQRSDLFCNN